MASSRGIPLDKAGIISTVLEALLYGFSLLMYMGTMWTLFGRRRSTTNVNHKMVVIATLLFILSTIHLGVDVQRIEEGLVEYRNTFPGGPPMFFADVAQETFVFKNAVYAAQTVVGDGVLIYRCYVVWQSVWVVILPIVMWCGVIATGIGAPYAVSQATTHASDIFIAETGRWITAFYSSTLATNFITTALLATRIWMIDRRISAHVQRRRLLPVLMVIIDAGVLYSMTLLAALICFVRGSNGQYVVLDMVSPIISIVFYMVIIRVGIRSTVDTTHYASTTKIASARTADSQRRYEMKPLQVHMMHVAETVPDTSSLPEDATVFSAKCPESV